MLTRRSGLPGGRAVAGALLVVTASVGTFAVARQHDRAATTDYPVLIRAVDPGEPITDAVVTWRPMSLHDDVATRTFTDPGDLADAVALVPLSAGQLLQRDLVAVGADLDESSGRRQLSIPVPADRTPTGLRRGEKVAVLATYGSGMDAVTVVTVESATVLAYESDRDAIGASDAARLTLALDDPLALVATAHAAQVAELTVVRTTSGGGGSLPAQYRGETPFTASPVPPGLPANDGPTAEEAP